MKLSADAVGIPRYKTNTYEKRTLDFLLCDSSCAEFIRSIN